ncbi:DUF4181 domain-containing protein [Ornithinibacillus halophilus]|uniref:DUF4181 domain-containing protein n=1 Tax=Ornithinibacillus halophilus TaxID=930117 RepID=A0A1M5FSI9_9BACI|nr:DUF4181 domain-containing protein [Ornithinibacillus halophilus]SHF94436.1 protein of unknown function [Ornithinibacillus halophilus]
MLYFIIAVLILTSIINRYIQKKYNIIPDGVAFRPVNNMHKWGERVILLVGLILAIILYMISYVEYYIIFGYLLILLGFRAFMEYKYDREEKEYLLTTTSVGGIGLLLIISLFIVFQTTTFSETIEDDQMLNLDSIESVEIYNNQSNEDAKELWNQEIVKREAVIENQQMINQIVDELSSIELRKRMINKGDQDNFYRLYFRSTFYSSMVVYDTYLTIDGNAYKVVGNNDFYDLLEEADFDWNKPGEKEE